MLALTLTPALSSNASPQNMRGWAGSRKIPGLLIRRLAHGWFLGGVILPSDSGLRLRRKNLPRRIVAAPAHFALTRAPPMLFLNPTFWTHAAAFPISPSSFAL